MKKILLTVGIIAYSLSSSAYVAYGTYAGMKKVKGVAVINCKEKPRKICAIISQIDNSPEDSGSWFVSVKDEVGNTVYEQTCSKVDMADDGYGGLNITVTEMP